MTLKEIVFGKKKEQDSQAHALDPSKKDMGGDLQKQIRGLLNKIVLYRVSITVVVVAGVLAFTALRMLRYMDPPANDAQVQLNLAKDQKIHLDPQTIQKIEQLGTVPVTPPNTTTGRTNPFAE